MGLDVAALYAEWHEPIRLYLLRQTRDLALAEDLAQETFLRAQRAMSTYQQQANVPAKSWLYRIARNLLTDHFRSAARRQTEPLYDAQVAPRVARDTTRQSDREIDMANCLGRLPVRQRTVLELRYLQCCSTRETAEAVGVSEDAVKKLQARGLLNMRRLLEAA